ncbi:MAG: hypothetical protein ACPLYF_05850, partial [Fervidobacterium sp.]
PAASHIQAHIHVATVELQGAFCNIIRAKNCLVSSEAYTASLKRTQRYALIEMCARANLLAYVAYKKV